MKGGLGYWPELAHTSTIMDLLYGSPLSSLAESLIGCWASHFPALTMFKEEHISVSEGKLLSAFLVLVVLILRTRNIPGCAILYVVYFFVYSKS